MATKRTRNLIHFMGDWLISDIADANNNYYIFASKYSEWANNFVADPPNEAYYDADSELREEMIFGKKVNGTNVSYLINRNTWIPNQTWAMFDDRDKELENKKYYIINSNRDVFKCIFNNNGAPSTVEPITKMIDVFELGDGYKWKYMYTLSSANNTRFGSTFTIPVDANTTVSSNATNGSIECVVVDAPGKNYEKYVSGRIQQVVSNTVFKLDSEKSAANGYYKYTNLFITSGTGDSNTSEIVAHYTNATGIYIQTANSLSLALDSYYLIAPRVYIAGDGSGFKAHAIIDKNMGTVTGIKIVDNGQDYMYADAYLQTDDPATGDDAKIRVIISPPGGHGKNAAKELNSKKIIIKAEFANTEGGTIPTRLSFRKFGLLRNPTNTIFSDVYPYTANTFDATLSLTINVFTSYTTITPGETFHGRTSGATGKVGYANSTYIMGSLLSAARFVNNEIIDTSNGVSGVANTINNTDLHTDSGTILFYDTTTEIIRSNTSTEDVGLIIRLD